MLNDCIPLLWCTLFAILHVHVHFYMQFCIYMFTFRYTHSLSYLFFHPHIHRRYPHVMPPDLASSLAQQAARGELLQWDDPSNHPSAEGSMRGAQQFQGHPDPGSSRHGLTRSTSMFGSTNSLASMPGAVVRPPYIPPPPVPMRTSASTPYLRGLTIGSHGAGASLGAASFGTQHAMASASSTSPSPAAFAELQGTPETGRVPMRDRRTHGGDGRVYRIISSGNLVGQLGSESIDE